MKSLPGKRENKSLLFENLRVVTHHIMIYNETNKKEKH